MPTPKPDPAPAPEAASPASAPAVVLQEPSAGGSYLRDPATGALSPNPANATQPDTAQE